MAREKWEFWQQIRNVCAHYKAFDVVPAHTVALYSFIEQYIFQIFIEGGKSSLLQEFDVFYNPIYTSPNADIEPILHKIDNMVVKSDLPDFIAEIRKLCNKYAPYSDRFIDTIDIIFSKCSSTVRKAFQDFIQTNNDLLHSYLEKYPAGTLNVIPSKPTIVHEFWYRDLPTYRSKLTILAILIEAGYIPDSDKNNAIEKCLSVSYENNAYGYYSSISEFYLSNG